MTLVETLCFDSSIHSRRAPCSKDVETIVVACGFTFDAGGCLRGGDLRAGDNRAVGSVMVPVRVALAACWLNAADHAADNHETQDEVRRVMYVSFQLGGFQDLRLLNLSSD